MIRIIRMMSILLAVASIAVFTGTGIYSKAHMDRRGPEIQMDQKEITVSIQAEEKDMLAGITAKDKKDGDVTDSLLVESVGAFIEKGERQISVAAFDSDKNVAKAKRTLKYRDYVSPRISLKEPLRAPVNAVTDLMDGLTATDCLEGDISENIQITPAEEGKDYRTSGEYKTNLIVSNNAGDVVELPVTIELYDYTTDIANPLPVLSEYLVYTTVGQPVDPMAYLTGVKVRGVEYQWDSAERVPMDRSQISIQDPAAYQQPGVYEISYTATDEHNVTGTVRLIVVVE